MRARPAGGHGRFVVDRGHRWRHGHDRQRRTWRRRRVAAGWAAAHDRQRRTWRHDGHRRRGRCTRTPAATAGRAAPRRDDGHCRHGWHRRHGRQRRRGTVLPRSPSCSRPRDDRLVRRAAGGHAVRRRQHGRHGLRRRRRILFDRRLDAATMMARSGGNLNVNQVFYVGGVAGQNYNVTIHVYGISEPKNYGTGVTRERGDGPARPPRRRARAPRRAVGDGRRPPHLPGRRTTTPTRSASAEPALRCRR